MLLASFSDEGTWRYNTTDTLLIRADPSSVLGYFGTTTADPLHQTTSSPRLRVAPKKTSRPAILGILG